MDVVVLMVLAVLLVLDDVDMVLAVLEVLDDVVLAVVDDMVLAVLLVLDDVDDVVLVVVEVVVVVPPAAISNAPQSMPVPGRVVPAISTVPIVMLP